MSSTPSESSSNFSNNESVNCSPLNSLVTPDKRPTITESVLITPQKEKKTNSNIKEANLNTCFMTNDNKEESSNSKLASEASVFIYYDGNNKLNKEVILEIKPRLSRLISRTKVREFIVKSKSISDFTSLCKYQAEHLAVPIKFWNDEKFKIQEMQLLKRPSSNQYKTSLKSMDNPQKNNLKTDYLYNSLKRKKIVHSVKKQRVFYKKFSNEETEEYFPVYYDQDMGIFEFFQLPLADTKIDDDALTDDEQLFAAEMMCQKQLNEAFTIFNEEGYAAVKNAQKNEALSNNNQI